MAVPTSSFAGFGSGPESRRSPRQSELWNVIGGAGGSSAGDTFTVTTRYMKKPMFVQGAVSYTIAGQVVSLTLLPALGAAAVMGIEIVGLP